MSDTFQTARDAIPPGDGYIVEGENRLAQETSPYLLQHKDNPVDWRPWGEEAFAKAREEGKPVLLSVGYAACHWCHVMAHESFEAPEIAALMNRYFVNIKLDREERPDLDSLYQQALALLGEQGGWPLTMFLTPDGEPFWGGTYFPPEPRYGRPGFPQVLQGIAQVYAQEPDKIGKNVEGLKEALTKLSSPQAGERIDPAMIGQIAKQLVREVDPFHGGIGRAPKFPQPQIMALLWRAWQSSRQDPYRKAVTLTLTRMCQGGIYDHLGGGFARYATDEAWLVPHFEKMLYDNAQMLDLLTLVWQETRGPLYEARAKETASWVLREMIAEQTPGGAATGAFASTLDADSEGEEGKFYVWTETEIDELLGKDAELFKRTYDVRPRGNWEGKTILNRTQDPELKDAETEARLARCREILFQAREARVHPGWDDKVLADWNGLMIGALARGAAAFGESAWLDAAERAFAFVVEHMQEDGRLKHAWRHGHLKHAGMLEDYAQMADAALALFEATGERGYLERARGWTEVADRHFWDSEGGGYFLTADDATDLILRAKNAYDSAVPSGNGTMLGVLARLFYLTGESHYRERADALVEAFSGEVQRNFFPLATWLNNLDLFANAVQIVIIGEPDAAATRALSEAVHTASVPNRVLQKIGPGDSLPEGHPAAGKTQTDGTATAYVCRGPSCSLPITDAQELSRCLQDT